MTKEVEFKDFKMDSEGAGGFTGYASVFGNFDSAKEAVVKGAFQNTLQYFIQDGFVALNHDWNGNSIGYVESASEDETGLLVNVKFHSTEEAQKVRTIMQERAAAGKSNRMSIGYKVIKSEPSAQGKLLKELKLYEVSVVNVPANELAVIGNVKSSGEAQQDPEPQDKQQNPDMVAVLVKAMLMGASAEKEMLMAGLENLCYRLQWKTWDILGNAQLQNSDKISLIRALYLEFAGISANAAEAFLAEPDALQTASAKALEFKAGRVLSDANFSFFSGLSEKMKGISAEMEDFLAEIAANTAKKLEADAPKTDDDTAKKAAEAELLAMGLMV
jgi:HK97 family phage prohead protease